ncbi:hypothetical protein KIN20_001993 [Parelaphostrongylus tenuis]|uniref:Uncharacterized protein n=1 Tax=Parelaphostrongylus tenuis TaxID=148309 RepID=A0AAD5LXU1_PARTN|nr:hypothetical protein KIN20_001993 [Parelaphostrongylus tenuis]
MKRNLTKKDVLNLNRILKTEDLFVHIDMQAIIHPCHRGIFDNLVARRYSVLRVNGWIIGHGLKATVCLPGMHVDLKCKLPIP